MTRTGPPVWQTALIGTVILLLPLVLPGTARAAETTLRIPGTGDSQDLLRAVAEALMAVASQPYQGTAASSGRLAAAFKMGTTSSPPAK